VSREVVGDAPDDAGSLMLREPPRTTSTLPPRPAGPVRLAPGGTDGIGGQPGGLPRQRSPRRSRVLVSALGLLALIGGAAFGWTASDAPGAGNVGDDVTRGTAASATVVTMYGRFDVQGQVQLDTLVRVVNLGRLPIDITGSEVAYLAAQTDSVSRVPLMVEAGGSALLRLASRLACASPLPLSLPPLTLRRADGLNRSLALDGARAELTRICSGGRASGRSLQVVSAGRDGERFRVMLDVPSGRTVRVLAMSAGNVALTGRPLPGDVDGQVRTIWLDPPTACAVSWRTQGIPRALDVRETGVTDRAEVAGVGGSLLHLDIGYELSRWLLDRSCSGRV
jgi:hypothetical protein